MFDIVSFFENFFKNFIDLPGIGGISCQRFYSIIFILSDYAQIAKKSKNFLMIDSSGSFPKNLPDDFEEITEVEIRNNNIAASTNKLVETAECNSLNFLLAVFRV